MTGDKCHICGDLAEQNCDSCKKPACKRHLRPAVKYKACVECANKAGE